jgi:hypothetical protein
MALLKVIVNKLNKRKSPVTDFADKSNVVAVVTKDVVIESVAQIENNLGVWHQDRDGLWSIEKGFGVTAPGINVRQYFDNRFDGRVLKEPVDYNFLLNVPNELKQTKGKDSIIGIFDVPISTNIDFENIVRAGNIITKVSPVEHSNFIAGICGSKATSNIQGICSMATILDLTFNDASGNLIQDDNYYNALISSIASFDKTPVIINVSYSLDPSVEFAIDKFKGVKNVLFVCSAGTNSDLLHIDNSPLVGNPNVISVGTASLDFLNSHGSAFDRRLNVVLPILNYVSYSSDGLTFLKIPDLSSSWGTAIVSCIIALLYSNNQLNKNSTKEDIISKINNLSHDPNSSYDFLNPLKF